MTRLHFAVRRKDVKTVNTLLRSGVDVNAVNKKKETPLHIAISYTNRMIIKLLLDKGADVNAKDKMGRTVLHRAVLRKKEVLKLLLKYNPGKHFKGRKRVTVDIEDKYGGTPLFYAAQHNLYNCIKPLVESNADANRKNEKTLTPFMEAVIWRNVKSVEVLLDCGVNINKVFNSDIDYPKKLGFLCKDEIKILIEKHITKTKVAGLYLNKCLMAFNSICEALPFHKECEEEIERMKQKISDTTISFHDILVDRSNKSSYGSNKNIALVFESNSYKMEFPIYAAMIERQYRRRVKRQKLLEETIRAFNTLSNLLPVVCINKITSHLSNCDLKILINACKRFH